ncbi:unnamed protein product [Bursaphelenchus okinawaensis]|uniref:Glutathione S-transferase n=1 Tax=Bursaphelenchus okinawaensis TaxID=465554 RepID=A0A811KLX1_9BILA|nr:unnamed protein product [Bursaphelenchus okinawaensis]CAG9105669.1 unnamed protein product [Bursaphelenchus okinawaensis]
MVQYKFTYGKARGLGEPVRLLLHYAGVPFEDERIEFGQVQEMRDELPFGQIPLLTIDGAYKISQSRAILRYLARKYNLTGKDEIEEAKVDSYLDFLDDLANNVRPYIMALRGNGEDKDKKYEAAKTYIETKWEKFFNKTVDASGSGFISNSGLTYPDFVFACFYETATKINFEPIINMKNFKLIHDNVKSLPQLKEYLSSRPDSQF